MSLVTRAARTRSNTRNAGGSVRRRKRLAALAAVAPAALALALPATSGAAVTAPHFVNVFPSRDFVHVEGYPAGHHMQVDVTHDPTLVTSVSNPGQTATATGTADANGIFEVNHVGGACWANFTPDIRPGDTVTITDLDAPAGTTPDSMVVQNVAGGRPVKVAADTVEIHGTAQNLDGTTRPDVGLLNSRLISPTRFFANGGKRNLNAPAVTYDAAAPDPHWTATYKGLTAADMDTALTADTSAAWTVADAAGTPVEGTSQETGANAIAGPTAGCPAALEKVQIAGSETTPPTAPGPVKASVSFNNTVKLDWTAATDPASTPAATGVISYSILRNDGTADVPVATVQSPDGVAPVPLTYTDQNVPAGTYTYKVIATDGANNDGPPSTIGSVTTTPNPAAPPGVPVNNPPAGGHSIIAFPARDFISADGYKDAAKVDVFVIHNGNIASSAKDIVPQGTTGLVEVNHPGGGCWVGNTPWLQPGDIVRTVAKDASGTPINADETTVANVTAERPIKTAADTVVVHGTATAPGGGQLPSDQIEQRLVTSTANSFTVNGKRQIRASVAVGSEGTLSYDSPTSTRWTATYKGLSADDVTRALGAESRGIWLGAVPAAGFELTIFENGDAVSGGPGAPCTAPAAPRPQVSLGATSLDFTNGSTKSVTIKNTGSGTQALRVDRAYIAGADPGSFQITKNACDGATIPAGSTCTVNVTYNTADGAAKTASLNVADNTNIVGFQSVALNGAGTTASPTPTPTPTPAPAPGTGVAPKFTLSPSPVGFGTVTSNTTKTSTVSVKNSGTVGFTVTPGTPSSTAFQVAGSTCTGTLAPGKSCNITVSFKPAAAQFYNGTLDVVGDNAGTKTTVTLSMTGTGK